MNVRHLSTFVFSAAASAWLACGQGTLADYQRAHDLQAKARGLVTGSPGAVTWMADTEHFWYPRSVKGGTEFVMADAEARTKKLAFDHERLAAALSSATGDRYTGLTLPFAPALGGRATRIGAQAATAPLVFSKGEKEIRFGLGGQMYKCGLADYTCTKEGDLPAVVGRQAAPEDRTFHPEGPGGDPVDGLAYQPPAPQDGDEGIYNRVPRSCGPQPARRGQSQVRNPRGAARLGVGSQFGGQLSPEPADVCASFDGKWEAYIENFNVFIKPMDGGAAFPLSFDGSEGNYYTLRTVAWSPDSKKLAAYHTRAPVTTGR